MTLLFNKEIKWHNEWLGNNDYGKTKVVKQKPRTVLPEGFQVLGWGLIEMSKHDTYLIKIEWN